MKTSRLPALARQVPHPDARGMIGGFTRVETSDSPFMGWTKAKVGSADPKRSTSLPAGKIAAAEGMPPCK